MKQVISTVGTSIITNLLVKNNKTISENFEKLKDLDHSEWDNKQERINKLKNAVKPDIKNNNQASAEIKSLLKLKEVLKDELKVYLLATDTVLSRLAAELISESLNGDITIHFTPDQDIIKGLQVFDSNKFEREGLINLINRISSICNGFYDNTILNITGGYKAAIPYLTIMGQVNLIPIYYIFEDTQELIKIPQTPLDINWEMFEKYKDLIYKLDSGIEDYNTQKNQRYHDYRLLEECGLVEYYDNIGLLSPIGKIFWERYKSKYFIFFSSEDVWNEIQKQVDIQRILKVKFCHPCLRNNKTEMKQDHYVYDDGKNNNRIYYFEENDSIYIYKTFENEEKAKQYINNKIDKQEIINESTARSIEKDPYA